MKKNKLLTIDQRLAKELIVFMFKQKNGKNPIAFKDVFTKNESKYNTETSLSLFQRNVLAQYVSKLFHTVVPLIGIAFPLT